MNDPIVEPPASARHPALTAPVPDYQAMPESGEPIDRMRALAETGRFTREVTHEFNNLFQNIAGSLEILKRLISANRPAEIDRFLAAAVSSVQRAAALTRNLQHFTRWQPQEAALIDLSQVVSAMTDVIRLGLPRALEIEQTLSPEPATVHCETQRFEFLILSLVNNAPDALPGGGSVVLESSIVERVPAGSARPKKYVCFAFGVSATHPTAERFERVIDHSAACEAAAPGLGRSLSMAHHLATLSDGYVAVATEVGRIVMVRVYLPHVAKP
ncbi:MAG: hypothetical protein ABIS68_10040 [Casimicrobiaceae bacterium]